MDNKDISDDRFAHISRDPRFRRPPKIDRKVKIDKRFKGMFNDPNFKVKFSADKRGKPVKHTSSENLKKFYELSDDSDADDNHNETLSKRITSDNHDDNADGGDDENADDIENAVTDDIASGTDTSADDDDDEEPVGGSDDEPVGGSDDESGDNAGIGTGPDLARGDGNVTTSDEDDDADEDDKSDAENESSIEHDWGERTCTVSEVSDTTHRLAICNMNWDRLKARDLFVMLNSFKPAKGTVNSVKIYPSDYGLARMKDEQISGPKEIVESGKQRPKNGDNRNDDDESRVNEGQAYHREKLRQYQLNRLKYYYAVADCDSSVTANHIYEECDGLEYEASSSKLDLSFIPDEMTFDQVPTTVCTDMPETDLYKPPTFLTTALCQSKVELTWDETDRERIGLTSKRYTKGDIKELDFEAYLASSSGDESDVDDEMVGLGGGYEFELPLFHDDDAGDGMTVAQAGTIPTKLASNAINAAPHPAKAENKTASMADSTLASVPVRGASMADSTLASVAARGASMADSTLASVAARGASMADSTLDSVAARGASMADSTLASAAVSGDKSEKVTVYKSLVNAGQDVHKKGHLQDMEMQVTWEPGLRDTTEKLVKKRGEKSGVTPWEEYLQKKKEKKKEKKQKKKLEKSDDDPKRSVSTVTGLPGSSQNMGGNPRLTTDGETAFSDDEVPEGIDLKDPFFAEELAGHEILSKSQKVRKKKKKRRGQAEDMSVAEKEELEKSKAELSLLMMAEQDDGKQHFNLKDLVEGETKHKSKKRRRKDKEESETRIEDTFVINVADPRFDAVYSSHHYNIDPTAPEFKKTKAMDSLIEEKLKRRKEEGDKNLQSSLIKLNEAKIHHNKLLPESNVSANVTDASISSLVKSVKLKTQQYHKRKKLK